MGAFFGLGDRKVVSRLEVQPQPGRCAEIGGKAQSRVGGNRSLAGDDIGHAALGYIKGARQRRYRYADLG